MGSGVPTGLGRGGATGTGVETLPIFRRPFGDWAAKDRRVRGVVPHGSKRWLQGWARDGLAWAWGLSPGERVEALAADECDGAAGEAEEAKGVAAIGNALRDVGIGGAVDVEGEVAEVAEVIPDGALVREAKLVVLLKKTKPPSRRWRRGYPGGAHWATPMELL